MKICLVSHSFLPTIGGAELVVHNLAKELSGKGFDTTVLTSSRNKMKEFNVNYKIEFFPNMPKGYLQGYVFALYLYLLQKRKSFDIIHIHKAHYAMNAIKIKKLLNVPIIVTTHGGDIQRYPEIGYGVRLDPKMNRRIEYAIINSDLVTAIGSSTRKEYMAIGVHKNKIVDIANGVNLKRFDDKVEDIRDLLKLSREAKILLSVGRYHVKKGYEYLIKAMPEITKHNEQARCLIVGRGLEVLKPLIFELSMDKYVILMKEQSWDFENGEMFNPDKVPNSLLLSAYRSSDIYVSSALIEGFALTLIEAMAAGLPVVATNVAGNEDAVLDGRNGFLVPPKDPTLLANGIIRLLGNNDLNERLAVESRALAGEYDWPIIANKYILAYKHLVRSD